MLIGLPRSISNGSPRSIGRIDLSSVCFREHLAECQVIHVLVRGRDLVGEGDR